LKNFEKYAILFLSPFNKAGNMDEKRLQQQIAFILEADKEKTILRQTHLSGKIRQENDAEHAWHMALMIFLLQEYSNEKIDLAKTMMMALIHDVVEIDAGDTYAYDETALATQALREQAAAKRIFGLLPPDQAQTLHALFNEFEANETPEARFAHAMDNFQPLLLNDCNDGLDWKKHAVTKTKVYKRQEKTKLGAEKIWQYTQKLIEKNVEKGNIKDE